MTAAKTEPGVLAEQTVAAGYAGTLTLQRRLSRKSGEQAVFVSSNFPIGTLMLSREEAADLAEALKQVSGMASCQADASILAQVVRQGMAREGVSKAAVLATTGITRYRLDRLLAGEVPMTLDELKAISGARS